MVSEEGLNAYGAVTWGQFFIFQGFNEHCGWMHTSSAVDASDLYEEKIISRDGKQYYEYDGTLKPLQQKQVKLLFRENGGTKAQNITTYATHHGPVVGIRNNKWLSLKATGRSLNGLLQSWQRTKAKGLDEFMQIMQLRGNPSTNTMYADREGNIAYWHGNLIPKRDASLDVSTPLDGSTSKTEWQGLHRLEEVVHSLNPKEGFLQNCNSSPFSISGLQTFQKENFPAYMAPEGENFRSLHAIKLLSQQKEITLQDLIRIGYSPYLAAFDTLLPPLFNDYADFSKTGSPEPALNEAIDSLKKWDRNAAASSVATTLAVFWAWTVLSKHDQSAGGAGEADQVKMVSKGIHYTSPAEKIEALNDIVGALQKGFGTWKVPWGELNRFQRLVGSGEPKFDPAKASLPVGLGPSFLGSLPSYETVWQGNRQYGVVGNSFVAAVSFGPKVRAKSISTGGQSFVSGSKHFMDQSARFISGELKDVYFYKEDVLRHAEKTYRPGEE
jgi:acyl-homoserine-lactone acylase